jgi:hypothetical protein
MRLRGAASTPQRPEVLRSSALVHLTAESLASAAGDTSLSASLASPSSTGQRGERSGTLGEGDVGVKEGTGSKHMSQAT